MFIQILDMPDNPYPERRLNDKLREFYPLVVDELEKHFNYMEYWLGTSVDFAALRLVHESFPELTPEEVRALVTVAASRMEYRNRLPRRHVLNS